MCKVNVKFPVDWFVLTLKMTFDLDPSKRKKEEKISLSFEHNDKKIAPY